MTYQKPITVKNRVGIRRQITLGDKPPHVLNLTNSHKNSYIFSLNPIVWALRAAHCGVHPVIFAVPEACFGVSKRLYNSPSLGMEDASQLAARFFTPMELRAHYHE